MSKEAFITQIQDLIKSQKLEPTFFIRLNKSNLSIKDKLTILQTTSTSVSYGQIIATTLVDPGTLSELTANPALITAIQKTNAGALNQDRTSKLISFSDYCLMLKNYLALLKKMAKKDDTHSIIESISDLMIEIEHKVQWVISHYLYRKDTTSIFGMIKSDLNNFYNLYKDILGHFNLKELLAHFRKQNPYDQQNTLDRVNTDQPIFTPHDLMQLILRHEAELDNEQKKNILSLKRTQDVSFLEAIANIDGGEHVCLLSIEESNYYKFLLKCVLFLSTLSTDDLKNTLLKKNKDKSYRFILPSFIFNRDYRFNKVWEGLIQQINRLDPKDLAQILFEEGFRKTLTFSHFAIRDGGENPNSFLFKAYLSLIKKLPFPMGFHDLNRLPKKGSPVIFQFVDKKNLKQVNIDGALLLFSKGLISNANADYFFPVADKIFTAFFKLIAPDPEKYLPVLIHILYDDNYSLHTLLLSQTDNAHKQHIQELIKTYAPEVNSLDDYLQDQPYTANQTLNIQTVSDYIVFYEGDVRYESIYSVSNIIYSEPPPPRFFNWPANSS